MTKKHYIRPVMEGYDLRTAEVLCQSSMGDVGGGSLNWGGSGGNDPKGNGNDFNWGN